MRFTLEKFRLFIPEIQSYFWENGIVNSADWFYIEGIEFYSKFIACCIDANLFYIEL